MKQPSIQNVGLHYAGVFLITGSGQVIGQRRDDKPTIDSPGKIGTFGGSVELGEDPHDAAWREVVQEETNLKLNKTDIIHFFDDVSWREMTGEWVGRHFYYAKVEDQQLDNMEVYEGQGWVEITGPDQLGLIELWRPIVKRVFDALEDLV